MKWAPLLKVGPIFFRLFAEIVINDIRDSQKII